VLVNLIVPLIVIWIPGTAFATAVFKAASVVIVAIVELEFFASAEICSSANSGDEA
jgi:hypothetical protein